VVTAALAIAAAVFYAGLGVAALITPDRVPRTFGITTSTPASRTEVRAVYGGFGVALAAVLAATPWIAPAVASGVHLAVAIATLGMAAGRLAGALLERPIPSPFYPTWFWLVAELAVGGALLVAYAAPIR
jgi:hypothetical protein